MYYESSNEEESSETDYTDDDENGVRPNTVVRVFKEILPVNKQAVTGFIQIPLVACIRPIVLPLPSFQISKYHEHLVLFPKGIQLY
jgi:hypothetical protein